jgi:D-serine deaminase-like pyridoxal phosphate-dependent protein
MARSIRDLGTPALLVDVEALDHNLATLSAALPGERLRPHAKAHKCTALARRQAERGHRGFTCATVREMIGLAEAGLGDDLLLANEVVDPERLAKLAAADARVTIAVDSEATIRAASRAGLREVLVDVNVGLPRCGCRVDDAGRLADLARRQGLTVRGVMGYEGHVVGNEDRAAREAGCEASMQRLLAAHAEVGGDVVSAGGTGTYDCNRWATEIQAGSYALMDTSYARLGLPLRQALVLWSTVISVSEKFAVADAGLKSLGMDHGNPTLPAGKLWFCSDEHVTFAPDADSPVAVGDRVRLIPAHVDPTVAYHERLHLVSGETVLDTWEVDLRGW